MSSDQELQSDAKPLEYNDDELHTPEWLNEEFFAKMLKRYEHTDAIEVTGITITPASQKGDHYASVMFRAKVDYKFTELDFETDRLLIIKTMPEVDGVKKKMLERSTIFECETEIYSKIIPTFESVLRANGIQNILAPDCLFTGLVPHKVLIFEDLVAQRYEVIRKRSLRMDEVKKAYFKIALFHATSYMLNDEEPEHFTNFKNGVVTMDDFMEHNSVRFACRNFVEMLGETPELLQFVKYFKGVNFLEESKPFFSEFWESRRPTTPYVLCHGDFHYKNMMFRQKSILDVLIMDFQLSYMGPMVMDIVYSFILLLSPEQRRTNRDELIYYYYSNFVETLQKIEYAGEIPKYSTLREELRRVRKFELFLVIAFLPMWYEVLNGPGDFDRVFAEDEYCRQMYHNEHFIEEMKLLLPYYLHLGYFDD